MKNRKPVRVRSCKCNQNAFFVFCEDGTIWYVKESGKEPTLIATIPPMEDDPE